MTLDELTSWQRARHRSHCKDDGVIHAYDLLKRHWNRVYGKLSSPRSIVIQPIGCNELRNIQNRKNLMNKQIIFARLHSEWL